MRSSAQLKKVAVGLMAAGALGLSTVSIAWACSYWPGFEPMATLDEEPIEPVDLPPAVTLSLERVKRSATPQRQGCSEMVTSCDDTAVITLKVEGYSREAGGLRFAIEGNYPESLVLPEQPVVLVDDPADASAPEHQVIFVWGDLDTMYEPIDAGITATWVDAWGREGETSAPVQVRNEGAEGGGCSVAGGAGSTGALVLAAALSLMLVSRRRVAA